MKIVKKLSFSLIEVGLALFLAATIIGLLFSTFTHSTKIKKQIEHASVVVLKRKYMQEKLTQMLASVSSDFKCSDNTLDFVFDQGPDIERAFSGKVKACIFLEQNQLIISLQSTENEDLSRRETLLTDISSIEWTFLPQPAPSDFGKDLAKASWDDNIPPLAIRLTLTLEDGSILPFAFFINCPIFEMST